MFKSNRDPLFQPFFVICSILFLANCKKGLNDASTNAEIGITAFSFNSFNKPTLQFLMGLIGFSILSMLSVFSLIRSNRKISNILIQKESELKTFLSVIDNMSYIFFIPCPFI